MFERAFARFARTGSGERNDSPPKYLYLITIVAVLIGLWSRFKGLGAWPLAADEYYIARSVQNILRTGLPAYDCGGLYTRGLAFQYAVALLTFAGMSAELSGRLLAATASVMTLPAAYYIGLRLHGRTVGLLTISLLALSAWEVDIARFGRMYAPFQAIFAWYLVFFIKHAVDGDKQSLKAMVILSIAGVLTWEGGIFLALTNLIPPFLRSPSGSLTRLDVRYLISAIGLLGLAYVFVETDFRTMGTDPYPQDFGATSNGAISRDSVGPFRDLFQTPLWLTVGITLGLLALRSLWWIWSIRRQWPAAIALTVALLSALLHQFSAVAFAVLIPLLAGMLHWKDLATRQGLQFMATIAASAVAWLTFAFSNPVWVATLTAPWGPTSDALLIFYEFLRFPDFPGVVALPWARSAPALGIFLLASIAIGSLRTVLRNRGAPDAEQVVIIIIITMLAVVSLSDPPRHETRYVVFLYPAAIALVIALIARAAALNVHGSSDSTLITTGLVATGFFLSGDFLPNRLRTIDQAHTHFSVGTNVTDKSNVLRRADARSAATWIASNRRSEDTLVINGYPTVDFYYPNFDYSYIDVDNDRFAAYACDRGRTDRWSNLPLLSTPYALRRAIEGRDRTLILIDTPRLENLLSSLSQFHPTVAWVSMDGYISIVEITP